MEFRCLGPGGEDLCFFGGVCSALNDSVQNCVCPQGFKADNSFFHDANCALWDDTYLAAMIISLVVTAVCLALLIPPLASGKKKGTVRQLYWGLVAMIVTFCGQVVAVYIEDGWFFGANVLNVLTAWELGFNVMTVNRMLLLPLFCMHVEAQRRVERLALAIILLLCLGSTSIMLTMVVTSPLEKRSTYNQAAVTVWLFFSFVYLFEFAMLYSSASRMIALLETALGSSSTSSASARATIAKLRSLMRTAKVFFPQQALGSAAISIVHLALGSFPFYYLLVLGQWAVVFPIFATLVARGFGRRTTDIVAAAVDSAEGALKSTKPESGS